MPRTSDFTNIKDLRFKLSRSAGGDIEEEFKFEMPSNAQIKNNSVLFFMADTAGSVKNLKLRVTVNEKMVQEITLDGDHLTSFHEVMGTTYLQAGDNDIKFHVYGGTGSVYLSDVVLFYRRDI